MTYDIDQILQDVAPFADLGTEAPAITALSDTIVMRMIRNGETIELSFKEDGSIIQKIGDQEKRHVHIRALLASPTFADLGRWASSQKLMLRDRVASDTIPVLGRLVGKDEAAINDFDDYLITTRDNRNPRTLIALLDGPAGIGKTSLIRSLAYRRADAYRVKQRPLILHVESRGRVLQNLTDLIAFSLQTLRLSVMYDQIPTLVRNGLVTLAIDGFDELGDPNGYELAWAQVNDVIVNARGKGVLLLSGRETFITEHRMKSALTAFDEDQDILLSYTISAIKPSVAKSWLMDKGWSDALIDSEVAAPLFEEGSYALRPFFLSELARDGVADKIEEGNVEDLLAFLIEAMIERESTKFGRDVEAVSTSDQRKGFVRSVMQEVARDLAENQSDNLSAETLAWIAEIVADETMPEPVVGILKNRAGVIAFLSEDDRRGYRRFIHEQVYNYFLSQVTIDAVNSGETPKFIRRNIFGVEALENFADAVRRVSQENINRFVLEASSQIASLGDQDRSRRNLGALLVAMCGVATPAKPPLLENIGFDEVYCTETLSPLTFRNVSIALLHARAADLRNISFQESSYIVSMIADSGTIPSESMPQPTVINLPGESITDPSEIERWIHRQRMAASPPQQTINISEWLQTMPLFDLLARVARYKPFWLKDGDEKSARKILDDPNWETLKEILLRHDLLVIRDDVPASGRPGPFYHIKNRSQFMDLSSPPASVVEFLQELLGEALRQRKEQDSA